MKPHIVIIIQGLNDNTNRQTRLIRILTSHWRNHGLRPLIYKVNWHDGKNFEVKLHKLGELVDKQYQKGNTISVVGLSAGGSAAINLLANRKNKIYKVINVCGRLKVGPHTGYRSFEKKTATSLAFAQSVVLSEKNLKKLSKQDRKKIMTIRAKFGDELVPSNTSTVAGTLNTTVPLVEHGFVILISLSVFSKKIINFIKKQ